MTTNKENFLKLITGEDTQTAKEIALRNKNRLWLKESKRIAIKILVALKEQGLSQKDLAERLQVRPQYISKLVKGGENLTLETITKLQDALGLELLASPTKKKEQQYVSKGITYKGNLEKRTYLSFSSTNQNNTDYKVTG